MLTPQEFSNKTFDKVMVWGYDMNAVDSFLETVEKDYTTLYKENAALKSKLKFLISKIDEYRKVDESMRKTLFSAQSMADDIIEKAKAESAEYRERTVADCARQLEDLTRRTAAEEQRLEEAKATAQVFIDHVLSMYANEEAHLTELRNREFPGQPVSVPAAPAENVPAPVEPDIKEEPIPAEIVNEESVLIETVEEVPFATVIVEEEPVIAMPVEEIPVMTAVEEEPAATADVEEESDTTVPVEEVPAAAVPVEEDTAATVPVEEEPAAVENKQDAPKNSQNRALDAVIDAVIEEVDASSDEQSEDEFDDLPDKFEIPSFNIPNLRHEKAAEAKPAKATASKRHFDLPNFDFFKTKHGTQPKLDDNPNK